MEHPGIYEHPLIRPLGLGVPRSIQNVCRFFLSAERPLGRPAASLPLSVSHSRDRLDCPRRLLTQTVYLSLGKFLRKA